VSCHKRSRTSVLQTDPSQHFSEYLLEGGSRKQPDSSTNDAVPHPSQRENNQLKQFPNKAEMLTCEGSGRVSPTKTRSQAGVTFTACSPFFP
jgi:hypothetical protein